MNVNYSAKKKKLCHKHRKINKRIEVRINKLNSLTQRSTDIQSSNFLFRKVVFHVYSLLPLWLAVRKAMGILVPRASILLVSVGDTRYTILTKRIEALGTRMSSRRFWEKVEKTNFVFSLCNRNDGLALLVVADKTYVNL